MPPRRPRINLARLTRELGNELMMARKARGWTRAALRRRLLDLNGDPLQGVEWPSIAALATYELGTRNVTVERFAEIAAALDVSAAELLTRAVARAGGLTGTPGVLLVDLPALSRSQDPRLQPLVAWASVRVRQAGYQLPPPVELDFGTLARLLAGSDHTPESVMLALEELRLALWKAAG